MKVVIICKSDGTGGAAVVSYRLMEALRLSGVDARMLVCEKTTGSPYVQKVASNFNIKSVFASERLQIVAQNGFSRRNLFDVDTGSMGLPLWKNRLVEEADIVILNWVNQGMLSLDGVDKICRLGKKVIWTMHDMWNCTGICHHAHNCRYYLNECGNCMLLQHPSESDMSHRVWLKKNELYHSSKICFVSVSSWLTDVARASGLLKNRRIETIPNPFPNIDDARRHIDKKREDTVRLVFGAARIDASIKDIDTFKRGLKVLKDREPALANRLEVIFYGALKNPSVLDDVPVKFTNLGVVKGFEAIAQIYRTSHIVVSTSSYENLPGSLIEGQAFGCFPVAFDRGGQKDIITHRETGYLMQWSVDPDQRASAVADALLWAASAPYELRYKTSDSVKKKFSYEAVADKYLKLFSTL